MDPDEVIILASPQHPIKAQRIKYYDDPLFKDMVARQEGKAFPYPPSVEGVGPWGEDEDENGVSEPTETAEAAAVRDRSQRRESRGMNAMAVEPENDRPQPETLEREADVPNAWEEALDRQGSFIDELLAE